MVGDSFHSSRNRAVLLNSRDDGVQGESRSDPPRRRRQDVVEIEHPQHLGPEGGFSRWGYQQTGDPLNRADGISYRHLGGIPYAVGDDRAG